MNRMKKYILALLSALLVLCGSSMCMAADINVATDDETKDVSCTIDIGRAEKSVSVLAKISDDSGNIIYLADGYTDESGKYTFGYNAGENAAGYFKISVYADGSIVKDEFFIGASLAAEGERYKSKNFQATITSSELLSGGAMLGCTISGEAKEYYLEYSINAPVAGVYGITARCTGLDRGWTTDFDFSVNGGEVFSPAEYSTYTSAYTEYTPSPGLLYEYPLGNIELKKGENILRIVLDKDDPALEGKYIYYIDCFKINLNRCEFDKISAAAPCGVFEKGSSIAMSADFTAFSPLDYEYSYKITDFYGAEKDSGTVILCAGSRSIAIEPDMNECGWYRLVLYQNGEEVSQRTFAIVPPYSERYQGETPFAADFAASQLVPRNAVLSDMAAAAKLAGVQWMRERTSWRAMQQEAGTEPDYREVNSIARILHDNGIKMTTILYGMPEWTDWTKLTDIYEVAKKLAENTDVDMWEIFNELDGGYESGPADVYSSFYKAAALGAADAGNGVMMSLAAQCMDEEASYNRLLMKNDLLKYSDIYNFHTHTYHSGSYSDSINSDLLGAHMEKSLDNDDVPFWITEAGLYIQTDENGEISDLQRAAQARYNVVSTVQSLAAGTDKHFWFIWPQFIENGKEMGTFDKNTNPNPSYQTQAVMSFMLGKAEYKGKLNAENAEGYVFDSGSGDVAVVWADEDTEIAFSGGQSAVVTDIMGISEAVEAENGEICVKTGKYPIYVSFTDGLAEENYEPCSYERAGVEAKEYNCAERIILQQSFDNQTVAASRGGYTLEYGKQEQMTVTVNNFNSVEKTVKLSGMLYGYDVVPEQEQFSVPAMGSVDVRVTLLPSGEIIADKQLNLIFSCETDGQISSPSASYVVIQSEIKEPQIIAPGYNSASSWKLSNIGTGGSATASDTADGVYFDVEMTDSNRWFYPQLKVTNAQQLADTDGVVFAVKADTDSDESGTYNIYCYLSDGRTYSLGGSSGIAVTDGWIQIKRLWSEFVLRSSSQVDATESEIDPELISYISVGGNFSRNSVGYTLKYLGYFNEDEAQGIKIISAWPGDDILKAAVVNDTGKTGEYKMIAAVYDEQDRLLQVHTEAIPVKVPGSIYDINIIGDMCGAKVKVFAWKGMGDLIPVAELFNAR